MSDEPVQPADMIRSIGDVKTFDKRYFFEQMINPVLKLLREVLAAQQVPYLFVVEPKCDIAGDRSGTINAYNINYGNLSGIRELPLAICREILTARDRQEIGARLGQILVQDAVLRHQVIQALNAAGVETTSDLIVQKNTDITH